MKKYYVIKYSKPFFWSTTVACFVFGFGGIALYIFLWYVNFFDMISGFWLAIIFVYVITVIFPVCCLYSAIEGLVHKSLYFSQYWYDDEKICFQNGKKYFEMRFEDIADAGITWRKNGSRAEGMLKLMYFSKRVLSEFELEEIFRKFRANRYQNEKTFVFMLREDVFIEIADAHPEIKFKSAPLRY